MRIQHNIMAMNSYRNFSNNTKALSKNLEKLSSGYRINRAGDDAAGLAISEKMRAQITGLKAAQKNAKDGISLVQTAEGAMTEVHSMLNRMLDLADQSANGTFDNEVDRANLQKEVSQLKAEVDRIADATNFNGIKLLDGSLSARGGSAAATGVKLDGNFTAITVEDATKWKMTSDATSVINATTGNLLKQGEKMEFTFSYEENGVSTSKTISVTLGKDDAGKDILIGASGQEYAVTSGAAASMTAGDIKKAFDTELRKSGLEEKFTFTATFGTDGTIAAQAKNAGAGGAKLTGITETVYDKTGAVKTGTTAVGHTMTQNTAGADSYYKGTLPTATYDGTNEKDIVITVNGKKYMLALDAQTDVSGVSSDVKIIFGANAGAAQANLAKELSKDLGMNVTNAGAVLSFKPGAGTSAKGGLTLQIGDTSDKYNKLTVSVEDMHTKALGIAGIDISTQEGGDAAVNMIKTAINSVSGTRGTLGALQNRLDHTINNLSVMHENIQDAEANIRDVDVAEEMMSYTKNNILVQSAQAMLAQANQVPQGVLQLLQ